jgi:hypothetical protein
MVSKYQTMLMRHFFFAATIALLVGCNDETHVQPESQCSTPATVRDFTGLDGCGFVFELNDGTYLEPVRIFYCGTPPVSEEQMKDPLTSFEFVDGKKVRIDYEEMLEMGSYCMAGKPVRISCVSEQLLPTED